jgi:hypothetical protein
VSLQLSIAVPPSLGTPWTTPGSMSLSLSPTSKLMESMLKLWQVASQLQLPPVPHATSSLVPTSTVSPPGSLDHLPMHGEVIDYIHALACSHGSYADDNSSTSSSPLVPAGLPGVPSSPLTTGLPLNSHKTSKMTLKVKVTRLTTSLTTHPLSTAPPASLALRLTLSAPQQHLRGQH